MPIYEFHCEKCGTDSEILVHSADWKGAECSRWGSKRLSKRLSTFAAASGGSSSPMASGGNGGGYCCGGACHCH